ncbi:M15 protein [Penaeus vannamei]|uniref:M15 protein n=1 Tax=Penaeus vannamei TaxID=6689 RepID=A0A423SJ04_PENVA|nr:M15 protein [Penaeus vannamei]
MCCSCPCWWLWLWLRDRPSPTTPLHHTHPRPPADPHHRDERVHPAADGTYSFDVETGDGIVRHESGGPGGAQQGTVSFTFPDGQVFNLQFVADVNGYQPQSPFLPVAPAFPTQSPPTPSSRSSVADSNSKLAPARNNVSHQARDKPLLLAFMVNLSKVASL